MTDTPEAEGPESAGADDFHIQDDTPLDYALEIDAIASFVKKTLAAVCAAVHNFEMDFKPVLVVHAFEFVRLIDRNLRILVAMNH